MRKLILLCASLCTLASFVLSGPADAQTILWVGPSGLDTNSCSQTAPCATFAGALGKGATQINCLGSGNYGQLNTATVSITGSLIIDCGTGNIGEMTTSGTNPAININAGSVATIVLRHLSLNGGGNNANGISTQAFHGTLIVENCMIHDFGQSGVLFAPSGGRGTLQVSDSLIYSNNFGVVADPAPSQIASVTLNRDELTANSVAGLVLEGGGVVAGTMRESIVGESGEEGVIASASQVFFTVEGSSIINNLMDGIVTNSAGAIVNVGATTIGGNGTGVRSQSGSIISFGNNQMSANGTNGNFTSTTALR